MTSSLNRRLLALAVAALLVAPGCSAFKRSLNPENLNEIDESKPLAIVYRTESDRLNLAGDHASGGVRQVSYHGDSANLLPPVSSSTLKVMYPHPEGRPDHARAFVAFSPVGEDSDAGSSFWTKLIGFGADSPQQPLKPFEIWALDVPKYQIDGIVAKLQKANFFRRSKVLNSKTYLSVSLDGKGFGKNYRDVDELDALIVRVRQQGWPVGPDGKPLQYRRTKPPRQQPGIYPRRAADSVTSYGSPAPGRNQNNFRPRPPRQSNGLQPSYQRAGFDQPRQRQTSHGPARQAPPAAQQPRFVHPSQAQRLHEAQGYFTPPMQHPAGPSKTDSSADIRRERR